MTEHTPGPWVAICPAEGWDGWWVEAAGEQHIAEVTGYQSDPVRRANAHLIAAAPDLLAACEAALEAIRGDADIDWMLNVERQLRTAIAKARGGGQNDVGRRCGG